MMGNFIKTQWEEECYPNDHLSFARAVLPSFAHPIHYLQPYPPNFVGIKDRAVAETPVGWIVQPVN